VRGASREQGLWIALSERFQAKRMIPVPVRKTRQIKNLRSAVSIQSKRALEA
jgi:hypothetical protein